MVSHFEMLVNKNADPKIGSAFWAIAPRPIGRLFLSRQLANVDPAKGPRRFKKLLGRKGDGSVCLACRRIDGLEAQKGIVKIDLHPFFDAERANPAGGVADQLLHLIPFDHSGFLVEECSVFGIADLVVEKANCR